MGNIDEIIDQIRTEVSRAVQINPKFQSPHEGWAVLLEEVDELWEEVKRRPEDREMEKMRNECIQIAAMAIRFATELCADQDG